MLKTEARSREHVARPRTHDATAESTAPAAHHFASDRIWKKTNIKPNKLWDRDHWSGRLPGDSISLKLSLRPSRPNYVHSDLERRVRCRCEFLKSIREDRIRSVVQLVKLGLV